MYCSICGTENKDTSKFCLTCGSKLVSPNDLSDKNVFFQLFDYFHSYNREKQRLILGVYFIWVFIHFSMLCINYQNFYDNNLHFEWRFQKLTNQFWPFIELTEEGMKEQLNYLDFYGFSEFFFYSLFPLFIYFIYASFKTKIK
jgi:hypothetical protein